jgi:uncharacterized protein YndB with AHSA1/START domain
MSQARSTQTLKRTYRGRVEEVWQRWTTAKGIESWWGPDGFSVKVRRLDLRPGGELLYAMTATAAPQVEFMKRAGMPLTTETLIVFKEIVAPGRLRYTNLVDFVPGVAPYQVDTLVELTARDDEVELVLVLDAMHDAEWNGRAAMGWEQELTKLGRALEAR